MTRDELREKVARAICYSDMNEDVFDGLSAYQKEQFICNADAALDTILAALKEPTEEMNDASRHLMLWIDGHERPTYKNLKTHCRLLGKTPPSDCLDIDHVPPKAQRTAWIFQAMLSASPLAPEEGGT